MKLNKWGLALRDYRQIHERSLSVKNLTCLASGFMIKRYKQYYQDFPKYLNSEYVRQDVDSLIQDGLLEKKAINGE
ncbi:unnamed protein product, partial [Didymodactylos carnosus]